MRSAFAAFKLAARVSISFPFCISLKASPTASPSAFSARSVAAVAASFALAVLVRSFSTLSRARSRSSVSALIFAVWSASGCTLTPPVSLLPFGNRPAEYTPANPPAPSTSPVTTPARIPPTPPRFGSATAARVGRVGRTSSSSSSSVGCFRFGGGGFAPLVLPASGIAPAPTPATAPAATAAAMAGVRLSVASSGGSSASTAASSRESSAASSAGASSVSAARATVLSSRSSRKPAANVSSASASASAGGAAGISGKVSWAERYPGTAGCCSVRSSASASSNRAALQFRLPAVRVVQVGQRGAAGHFGAVHRRRVVVEHQSAGLGRVFVVLVEPAGRGGRVVEDARPGGPGRREGAGGDVVAVAQPGAALAQKAGGQRVVVAQVQVIHRQRRVGRVRGVRGGGVERPPHLAVAHPPGERVRLHPLTPALRGVRPQVGEQVGRVRELGRARRLRLAAGRRRGAHGVRPQAAAGRHVARPRGGRRGVQPPAPHGGGGQGAAGEDGRVGGGHRRGPAGDGVGGRRAGRQFVG